jgi:hypothetical protein
MARPSQKLVVAMSPPPPLEDGSTPRWIAPRDTINSDPNDGDGTPDPETEVEKQRRLAWEAEMIVEARAELDAWIDSIGTEQKHIGTVIPAKAGTPRWVPAFAGMTEGSELPGWYQSADSGTNASLPAATPSPASASVSIRHAPPASTSAGRNRDL